MWIAHTRHKLHLEEKKIKNTLSCPISALGSEAKTQAQKWEQISESGKKKQSWSKKIKLS